MHVCLKLKACLHYTLNAHSIRINANFFRPHLKYASRECALNWFKLNPLPEVVSMRIEVDYSGRGATRSVMKWIAVGVALHVALCELVFCGDKVVLEVSFNILHC